MSLRHRHIIVTRQTLLEVVVILLLRSFVFTQGVTRRYSKKTVSWKRPQSWRRVIECGDGKLTIFAEGERTPRHIS